MTAVVKEYTLAVSDGTLNVDFSATVNRPLIAAIEVFQVAPGGSGRVGLSAPLRQTSTLTYTTTVHIDYAYDGVGRLSAETTAGAATEYGYDAVGNRTSVTQKDTTTITAYNAADQVDDRAWTYDAVGNLLTNSTIAYTYDALGRLTSAGSTTNQYNGDGVLVGQQVPNGPTTTLVNDLLAPLSQVLVHTQRPFNWIGPVPRTTAIYGRERLATTSSGTRMWALTDGVGSVQMLLDDAGAAVGNPQYDAWGNSTSSPAPAPFGYTGEYRDSASGLTYLRARWYDPTTGTLLGRDPFAGDERQPGSLHPYQYAYNDPVLWNDPSGLCPVWEADCEPTANPLEWDWKRWIDYGWGGDEPKKVWKSFGLWCLQQIGLNPNGDGAPPYPTGPRMTIVELGSGVEQYNLVKLAEAYPNSKVYGIEGDAMFARTSEQFIRRLQPDHIKDRISLHVGDFRTLQVEDINGQADIVVAVAPDPSRPASQLYEGINNFAKSGAQVVVLTEDRGFREELMDEFTLHGKTASLIPRTLIDLSRSLGLLHDIDLGAIKRLIHEQRSATI